MADVEDVEELYLVDEVKIFSTFKREGAAAPSSNNGNHGIVSQGSQRFKLPSTDILVEKVKSNDDFANNLENTLRKTLGDRQGIPSDSITVFWKILFTSESNACVELTASGNFLESFLREYKLPVEVALWFELQLENDLVSICAGFISPSFCIGNGSTDDFRPCVFKFASKREIQKPIPTDKPIPTLITISLSTNRNVVIEYLPCKMAMGQSILENKTEFDFAIIAEDDTRLECNKVFLACNSKAWAGMLQMNCKETKEKAIKLKMSTKGVNALLKFIYYANIDDPLETPSIALELLEIGHQYDILGLEEAMRTLLLAKKNEWFDIDTALLLYLRTLKVEGYDVLKWKALQAFKSKPDDLEDSIVYDKLSKEDSKTAKQMMALCFKI